MAKEPSKEGPIETIDIPGIKADGALLRDLRREVANLLGRDKLDFPGAQPVSFTRHHLDELMRQDYYVCEKSDGIRYLLYLTDDGQGGEAHYLIDRKNDYWFATGGGLHMPTPEGIETFHRRTIVDGELVMDDMGNGTQRAHFLVFDCLVLDGQNLMRKELSKRLGYFQDHIYKPYKSLFDQYPQEKTFQPFLLGMKQMEFSYAIEMMFHKVIKELKHGNDGLIFTCLHSEYKPGTDPHILKWKEADENTVDFQWKFTFHTVEPDEQDSMEGVTEPYIDYEGVPHVELLAYHGGDGPEAYRHFGEMWLSEEEWEELKSLNDPLDERIVEVYMDSQHRWRFYRFRDDKKHGNHISVVNSVIDSIHDGVTKEDLAVAAKVIRDRWKERHRKA